MSENFAKFGQWNPGTDLLSKVVGHGHPVIKQLISKINISTETL